MLDRIVIYVVFLLVAMAIAEDGRQQQFMCRLRRIVLPVHALPKMSVKGVLRWLCTLLIVINETIISLAGPMLPFGVVFLMLTEGADAASALLNGLAMGFVLQIDDLLPSIFFSPLSLAKIESYLLDLAAVQMARGEAHGLYGYVTASPFIAASTVLIGFATQVGTFGTQHSTYHFAFLPTYAGHTCLRNYSARRSAPSTTYSVTYVDLGAHYLTSQIPRRSTHSTRPTRSSASYLSTCSITAPRSCSGCGSRARSTLRPRSSSAC
jgi:hypothetical protein